MSETIKPTGKEVFFPASELIVSKTDLKGRMTYVNRLFCKMAGYSESELIGQ
ncbi:MAG: PAS domain S-box protein, partial [Bradyrhizobiaceae bacterium]